MARTRRKPPVNRARDLHWQLSEWARVMGVPLLAAQQRAGYVAPGTDEHAGVALFAGLARQDLTDRPNDENVAGHTLSNAATKAARTRRFHHMSTTTTVDAPKATTPRKRKTTTAAKVDVKAMTPAQRAEHVPAGLAGKARERFIATGETLREQSTAAKAKRTADAKAAKSRAASERAKAAGTRPPVAQRDGITAMEAAERVLRKSDGPMRVSAIAQAAVKLSAFKPTGKTPEASVAARVHVSAKTPDGMFVRVERGVVDLRELNPRAAAKRPTKRS